MATTMRYECTDCGTNTGNHEFNCALEEYDYWQIERAYVDILSILTDKDSSGVSKKDLVSIVYNTPNGAWTKAHESVFKDLVSRGLIAVDDGTYSLPENDQDSKHLSPDSPERVIREALFHVDPDIEHDKWVRLGFSVCEWDAGEDGKSLFLEWSKQGDKWDRLAKNKLESIWESYNEDDDGATLSTLAYFAKRNGW